MGLQHIAPQLEEDNRRIAQHETFRHLFPEDNSEFFGFIRITEGDYGDLIVIKDASNVPSSPWWFSSLMNFTNDFLSKEDSPGSVFEIQIRSRVVIEEEGLREVKIFPMGYKKILD